MKYSTFEPLCSTKKSSPIQERTFSSLSRNRNRHEGSAKCGWKQNLKRFPGIGPPCLGGKRFHLPVLHDTGDLNTTRGGQPKCVVGPIRRYASRQLDATFLVGDEELADRVEHIARRRHEPRTELRHARLVDLPVLAPAAAAPRGLLQPTCPSSRPCSPDSRCSVHRAPEGSRPDGPHTRGSPSPDRRPCRGSPPRPPPRAAS